MADAFNIKVMSIKVSWCPGAKQEKKKKNKNKIEASPCLAFGAVAFAAFGEAFRIMC